MPPLFCFYFIAHARRYVPEADVSAGYNNSTILGKSILHFIMYISHNTQQPRDIVPMVFQCWSSVENGGPTLKQHWVNASLVHSGYNNSSDIRKKYFNFIMLPYQPQYPATTGYRTNGVSMFCSAKPKSRYCLLALHGSIM